MFQNSEGGAATRDADAPFGASGKVVAEGASASAGESLIAAEKLREQRRSEGDDEGCRHQHAARTSRDLAAAVSSFGVAAPPQRSAVARVFSPRNF